MTEDADIAAAVALLRAGELVAFPTETVYGLGADAQNPAAVAKIFAAKGRPADHPLIVHVPAADALTTWAAHIPPAAMALARAFWPGPLTLILERSGIVPDAVTGGQNTVGLRVPNHPLALKLLRAFGGGLAAPSANRFGRLSPTTAQHVRDELGAAVPLILEGGACTVGIESTIIDFSSGVPVLLRPGMLGSAQIEAVLGHALRLADGSAPTPRASGTLEAHYAPRTPLVLATADELPELLTTLCAQGRRVGVLARTPALPGHTSTCLWHHAAPDTPRYAHDLYASLHRLDGAHLDCIVVEAPPDQPEWDAIRDRLQKSAAGSGR
jgi:L-threonylcarbamoyladenylate synthase